MESGKGFFVAHMKAAGAPPNIALKSSLFPDRDVVGVVAALEPGRFDHTHGENWPSSVSCHVPIWGFPKMLVPQQPWVFLLKMIIIWGGDWGYHHLRKHPFFSNFFFWMGKSHGLWFSSLWFTLTSKKKHNRMFGQATQAPSRWKQWPTWAGVTWNHLGCQNSPLNCCVFVAGKKRGWVFSNEGSNPLSQDCQIKEVGTKLFQEQKQNQGSFYDIIPNFILFPVRSIKIPIRPHCLISPKWVPLNGSLDN